jgi:hypothetical protein
VLPKFLDVKWVLASGRLMWTGVRMILFVDLGR